MKDRGGKSIGADLQKVESGRRREREEKRQTALIKGIKNIQIQQKKDKASIEFKYKCEKTRAGSR